MKRFYLKDKLRVQFKWELGLKNPTTGLSDITHYPFIMKDDPKIHIFRDTMFDVNLIDIMFFRERLREKIPY